jgi:hypothetical protein
MWRSIYNFIYAKKEPKLTAAFRKARLRWAGVEACGIGADF